MIKMSVVMAVTEMQRSRNERIWGRSVADYRYFAWMVEELYAHGSAEESVCDCIV